MIVVFIKYYAILCVLLCLIYAIGIGLRYIYIRHFLKAPFVIQPTDLFVSLLVGLAAVVTALSIYATGGKTVHLLFVLVLGAMALVHKRQGATQTDTAYNASAKFEWKNMVIPLLLCMLFSLPFMLYEASFLLKSGSFPYNTTDTDYSFYSIFSESIFYSGSENKFTTLNVTFPQLFNGCVPYHYFELYLNSIGAHLFGLPTLASLMLLTYPLLNTIVLSGLVYVAAGLGVKVNVRHVVLLVVLMGLSGIFLQKYASMGFLQYASGPMAVSTISAYGKKNLSIILFALPVAYCFARRHFMLALVLAANLIIVNVGTLPGVLGAVALTALAGIVFKEISFASALKLAAFYVLFLACFIVFYKLNANSYTSTYLQKGLIFDIIKTPTDVLLYKQIIVGVFTLLARFLVYYAPIAVVLLLVYVKASRGWLYFMLFTVLAMFFGAVGASLAYGLMDALQLFGNVLPIASVFIYISLLLVVVGLGRHKLWQYAAVAYVVLISVFSLKYNYNVQLAFSNKAYGDEFVLGAAKHLGQGNVTIAGFILSPDEYRTINPAWVYRNRPALFLQNIGNGYRDMIDLGILYANIDIANEKPHDQYYYSLNEIVIQQQQLPGADNDSVLLASIDKLQVKSIFVSAKAEVPAVLKPRIKQRLIDKVSGEKMLVLQ